MRARQSVPLPSRPLPIPHLDRDHDGAARQHCASRRCLCQGVKLKVSNGKRAYLAFPRFSTGTSKSSRCPRLSAVRSARYFTQVISDFGTLVPDGEFRHFRGLDLEFAKRQFKIRYSNQKPEIRPQKDRKTMHRLYYALHNSPLLATTTREVLSRNVCLESAAHNSNGGYSVELKSQR
jgi:hypothetical protein